MVGHLLDLFLVEKPVQISLLEARKWASLNIPAALCKLRCWRYLINRSCWPVQRLQLIEGDFVMQYNPNLTSLAGAAQSLTSVQGQVSSTLAGRCSLCCSCVLDGCYCSNCEHSSLQIAHVIPSQPFVTDITIVWKYYAWPCRCTLLTTPSWCLWQEPMQHLQCQAHWVS